MNFLLMYSGKNGQTKKIILNIYKYLINKEKKCKIKKITFNENKDKKLLLYDKIVIGAAVYYGNFQYSFLKYINQNVRYLNNIPTAFFGVNLLARKKEKNTVQTNFYMKKFLKNTLWKPKIIDVFAGSLNFKNYKWYEIFIIKIIMQISGNKININQKYEYTNWKKVQEFSKKVGEL
ncbi:MAG: menaquinone-dependent protoporphyrinogen IX dehydrogenase [Arsenophonus sp.]|nr:MAG: menaquinone-dependent protoporphyrinogen IX dehydrogenase [Arsenophonus sp.]